MVDKNIVLKKINLISDSLKRVENYKGMIMEDFLRNRDAQDIVLHNLFIMLQYVIDIGTHIIADDRLGDVSYLSDISDILLKEKIIPYELKNNLREMIGFRNIIAHQYGDLDLKLVYKITHENLEDVNLFLKSVIEYYRL